MTDRLKLLKMIKEIIRGLLILLSKMNITNDYTDGDLKEIQNSITRAKVATDNSLHTYNSKRR